MNRQDSDQQSARCVRPAVMVVAIILTALIVGGIFHWRTILIRRQAHAARLALGESNNELKAVAARNVQLKQRAHKLEGRVRELEQALSFGSAGPPVQILTIYGIDMNTGDTRIECYVRVPPDLPVGDKLRVLADRLSRYLFSNSPIESRGIKSRNGRKIVVIDLVDPPAYTGRKWSTHHFQGSTGGALTTVALTETFLQREYAGQWVDGVEFLYNGQPIRDEWDHIFLSGTFMR